jgi:hypothetical protein
MHGNFTILSGTANRSLAAGVSQLLEQPSGDWLRASPSLICFRASFTAASKKTSAWPA